MPVLLLFAIGWWLGAVLDRRRPLARALPASRGGPEASMVTISIDRDSVHAGDDGTSHRVLWRVRPGTTWLELLARVQDCGFLASIHGGCATWVVEVQGPQPVSVAGCAQQWPVPRLLVPDAALAELLAGVLAGVLPGALPGARGNGAAPGIYFKYLCQQDPQAVFDRLAAAGPR